MGFNPCCCWNLKDGCITVGIWSMIFSLVEMGIFGWQTADIKYWKDRAANTLLPNYNTYGRYGLPAYYESYWQSKEERFYTALMVVQILSLIAAFFLLFASVSLIYGIHTNSRYLVWPWFPCIVASMLGSIVYCVMWWSDDVRSYWLVLTILLIVSVMFNVYCLIAVVVQYRRILVGRGDPEWYKQYDQPKDTVVHYDHDQRGFVEPRKEHQFQGATQQGPAGQLNYCYNGFVNYDQEKVNFAYGQQLQQPFDGFRQAGELPEKTTILEPEISGGEDYTSRWLKETIQRPSTAFPELLPLKDGTKTLKPSRSVPSIQAEAVSSTSKLHHRSRRRHHSAGSKGRFSSGKTCSSDSEYSGTDDERHRRKHHHLRHQHHRHRHCHDRQDKYSDTDTGYSDRSDKHTTGRRREHRARRERRINEEQRDGDGSRSRRPRGVKRDDREKSDGRSFRPPPGCISIPQHIVVPRSADGCVGPDGKSRPQKFQINSAITISYNGDDRSVGDSKSTTTIRSEPKVTTPGVSDVPDNRDSFQSKTVHDDSSADSRGHGSTAV